MKKRIQCSNVLQYGCQALIVVFAFFALRDCITRSSAGGLEAPGAGMVIFSLGIAAILAAKALSYWGQKTTRAKEQAAIMFSLLVEIFLWYTFHSSWYKFFFYINTILWATLSIWSMHAPLRKKYDTTFLIVFFCKGAFLAFFFGCFLWFPWLVDLKPSLGVDFLLVLPRFLIPFYQMFLLGVIWHLREKKDKAAKHTER